MSINKLRESPIPLHPEGWGLLGQRVECPVSFRLEVQAGEDILDVGLSVLRLRIITSGCRGREDPSPSGEGMNRAPPLCRKL